MKDNLEIRPYRDADKNGVLAFWNEAFPNNPTWNIPEQDISRKLNIQGELFLVAESA